MDLSSFGASDRFLMEAALKYFSENFENPPIKISQEIDTKLGWRPTLHFKATEYLTVAVEVSETPYPTIFRLRHAEILNVHMPISVFCVCPEEAFLQQEKQTEVQNLQSHGYGLLTVDRNGSVMPRIQCIPLIQHIPADEFRSEIKGLSKKLRLRLREAFSRYNSNPGSGLQELSEVAEGLIINTGKKLSSKGWIGKVTANTTPAWILDEMTVSKQCKGAIASVGGMRSFMKDYRNTAHHVPKNKTQAYKKYQDCQHGFREGLKRIKSFLESLKALGVSVNI